MRATVSVLILLLLAGCGNGAFAFGQSSHWRCEKGLIYTEATETEPAKIECAGLYVEHVGGAMSAEPGRLVGGLMRGLVGGLTGVVPK